MVYVSLSEAVVGVGTRLGLDTATTAALLGDVSRLLGPRKIVVSQQSVDGVSQKQSLSLDHPSAFTVMALSDLRFLFENDLTGRIRRVSSHVVKKITFYAAHVLAVSPAHLDSIAKETSSYSKTMQPSDSVNRFQ